MSERNHIALDAHVAAAEHVRCRQFDDELVMLHLERGQYFSLDPIGARMWGLLISGKTPAEVAADLLVMYEAAEEEILLDCVKLVDELLERGLVVLRLP